MLLLGWGPAVAIKQAVRIILESREPFGFAGLWDERASPHGDKIPSYTIIITKSNELLKPVHDRMPVILSPEAEDVWLNPSVQDPLNLLPLLKPYPSEQMGFYEVSRVVNSPGNDVRECVVKVG
jgi:putative SOS response-associated peptidase YedK